MKENIAVVLIVLTAILCIGIQFYLHGFDAKPEPVQKTPEEIELQRKRQQKEDEDMMIIIMFTTIPVVVQ